LLSISFAMATTLPQSILIRSNYFKDNGHFYCKEDGSVALGEESVFSTVAKIEVERAKINHQYVHLRFSYTNKYWRQKEGDKLIVAESTTPEEDTSKSSCTLFAPMKARNTGLFYLIHVPSGARLLIDEPTMTFYSEMEPRDDQGYLKYINYDDLVKLPSHVAFAGDNGKYLKTYKENNYLQFDSEDPYSRESGHKIYMMPDGHVRIYSDGFGKFWRRDPNWIKADSSDDTTNNSNTLFWPVKIDDDTIALQNAANDNFCVRLTTEGKTNCLNAQDSTITKRARIKVEELVMGRRIRNVRYLMENARIYDESPYTAGTATLENNADQEAEMSVAITYKDEKSYTYSRGLTITAGVNTSIEVGVPFIGEKVKIEYKFEISGSFRWDNTTTRTEAVTAKSTVKVAAKTRATLNYVGTKG
ncbi:ETX/MTX2 family pore-forming toxin, partial [Escherichia albertii]|uniref:ETX/MTX2 family pore-forming toxin n=1 Tax=Escherichia albertii TaxID=208962 RepID=UPI003F4707EE